MNQLALYLGRAAVNVRTEPLGLVIFLDQRRPAVRTHLRENRPDSVRRPEREIYIDDLRNDLTAFDDRHCVADSDVHLRDKVLIVKGCPLNNRTGQLDRSQIGDRSHGSSTTDLIGD